MSDEKMPHPNHEKHLCHLISIGYGKAEPGEYKSLIKNGQYYCKSCGRVAADAENLCLPEKLS